MPGKRPIPILRGLPSGALARRPKALGHRVAQEGLLLAPLFFALVLRPLPVGAQAPATTPGGQASGGAAGASAAEPAPQQPVGPEEVVMTVGDTKITAAEFEKIFSFLPPQFQSAPASLGKRGFANQYANLLGLALEGQKRKVDQKEEFQHMLAFERMVLLAQLTLNELLSPASAINPEEVKAYYTAHQGEFEQAKVRGIYVPFERSGTSGAGEAPPSSGASESAKAKAGATLTEAQAQAKVEALRKRIQAGESMATLAKSESDHPTSQQGGDFGYVGRGQFATQIEDIIFSIPLNQLSAPVRDRFGFFLFQVEARRAQPVEEATPSIENKLRQQNLGSTLTKVQGEYPVTLNPRYFTEPASPPAMGAPQR